MSRIQISIQLQYTGEGIIFNVFLFGHFLGKIQAFQSLKAVIRLLWDNKCNYSLKEMLLDTLGTITIILCSTMSLCFFRFLSWKLSHRPSDLSCNLGVGYHWGSFFDSF